ncbi:hypothetical protein [Winogradskyella sp.]|uniref:hypothetical protein n=1 Tax=Winogradskyella sp. TaxID=1883156 RepID=UPI003F6C2666
MRKDKLNTVKSAGFKTPEKYFDSVEDKLFSRIEEPDTIEDINSPGFTTPIDYFDAVEGKILDTLNTNDKPVVHLFARQSFYYVAGIAASLLLLFAIFINVEKTDELTGEMVEAYFQNSDLDTYDIAQLLLEADMLEDDFTITETSYSEENLENYLLDNVDIEAILE